MLDLGPDHPSRAGLLELQVSAVAGVIDHARILPGAMHRGAEKLFEARDYRQILMLADRHDWQAPFFGELAAAEAFEGLLRLEPPPRAIWIRTLLAEHTRILSHFGFLAWAVKDDADLTLAVRAVREHLRTQSTALTGNRIHLMATRIGGVAVDPSPEWLTGERELMNRVAGLASALLRLDLPGAGIAAVDSARIDGFGLSGPMARAAGVTLDSRVTAPTGAYAALAGLLRPTPTRSGDARARFMVMADECLTSARLVEACCDRMPSGPVRVRLPKIVKLPEAEIYSFVEAPLGRAGFHVVSRGDKTPWRMKLRSPSFHHVASLEALLPGTPVAHVETVLASVGYVVGDLDK